MKFSRDRLLITIESAAGQTYRFSWKNFLSVIAILLFSISYILVRFELWGEMKSHHYYKKAPRK